MAKERWSGDKVKKLVEAVEAKDLETVDAMVLAEGNGKLPQKAYGRSQKYGPASILAACIRAEDIALFNHLLDFGMKLSLDEGFYGDLTAEVLFGGGRDDVAIGGRDPRILRRIAEAGFDFSTYDFYDIGPIRAFVTNNKENIELLRCLEAAGLKYPTSSYCSNPEFVSDDDYVRGSWDSCESIPWEQLLVEERFDLLDHFIDLGYWPSRALRFQVGSELPQGFRSVKESALGSEAAVDYLCEKGLPTFGVIVPKAMEESDKTILGYCIKRGVKPYNPEQIFQFLDYELIKLALDEDACAMKAEYAGAAQTANRQDILDLYAERGVASDDVTSVLVEELETLIRGAEFTTSAYRDETFELANNPHGTLKVIDALNEGTNADWRTVAILLARLYCASFDTLDCGRLSKRAKALKVFAGDSTWPEVFESCLGRFEGNLDLELTLPMAKIANSNYRYMSEGSGITYWFHSDAEVYRLLTARGARLSCKHLGDAWMRNPDDVKPGDAFIWLAPDVSDMLFAQNGWEKKNLEVTSRTWAKIDYSELAKFLIASGNRVAYQWFVENASGVAGFKPPVLKDVVETMLLRPYLESKEDASVRSKHIVGFVMQTIYGDYADDTALFVTKAALNEESAAALKKELAAVEGEERQAIAREAIAIIDSREIRPKAKKTGSKKPTVPQTVTLVAGALDEGDSSTISLLEPVAAKVPMADCVELLERAAANCDAGAIDRLYDLFAPFECASSALLIALFSGNASTARALVSHGATLEGRLVKIDEKRTPSSKKAAREKRYSHGLIGQTYSAGGTVARNLREALTKYNGQIESRTKTAKDWGGRPEKLIVNKVSNKNAADTLVAISNENGFKKSIAIRLLWNLISFDGRRTTDACFDATNARTILKADILSEDDLAKLPWSDAVDSLMVSFDNTYGAIKLVHDFAPSDEFVKCWRPIFAKPNKYSGKYDNIKSLLLFVDVLTADNCSNQMDVLRALVHEGKLKQLKKLAAKPGWFTKQRIKTLLSVAGDVGQTEVAAWLLDLSEKDDRKQASPKSLEL